MPGPESSVQQHLPGCEFITYAELARRWGVYHGLDPEFAQEAGIVRCVDECPRLGAAIKRGQELAAKYGW